MHIAVVNGFPYLPNSAEVEYIQRLIAVAPSLGHCVHEVFTSDDIHHCAPDFVLVLHEFTPKLTPFFTVGALWSPTSFYERDRGRVRSILSYDAYLPGSPEICRFLDDLEFATGIPKPRSDFFFLPTAPARQIDRTHQTEFQLVYVGVHWDGFRHNDLIAALRDDGLINLYGPPTSWAHFSQAYRGQIPFDGSSIYNVLASHGIALCLHKDDHRAADTPSMRLFEAAAAGCLIISDSIPFARRVLGDSAFHLDLSEGIEVNRQRIAKIISWANEYPDQARDMAARSHQLLREQYSIEIQLQSCCDFVASQKADLSSCLSAETHKDTPVVQTGVRNQADIDVVVRTGGRSIEMLKRALRSIELQRAGDIRVILVDYKCRKDVRELAREYSRYGTLNIKYVRCADTGLRSTALWTGLQYVTAKYFAMLDDDDTIMPDHYGSLLRTASLDPSHGLYYSGVIRVEEEPGDYVTAPNHNGPLTVELGETRELQFLDTFDLMRLVAFDNYIQSNAWIARTDLLDPTILTDPNMSVAEDMYLYFMLARKTSFKCSCSPTAYWYWRSSSRENSMFSADTDAWDREVVKLLRRVGPLSFPGDQSLESLRRTLSLKGTMDLGLPVGARPTRVALDKPTFIDTSLTRFSRKLNLNDGEENGAWTSSTEAHLKMRLEEVVDGKLRIKLRFNVAGDIRRPQSARIRINDQVIFDSQVAPFAWVEVDAPIFLPGTDVLFLSADCRYTVNPKKMGAGTDARTLGVFLSEITCERVN
jgi:hypothetical protein